MTLPAVPPEDSPDQVDGQRSPFDPDQQQLPLEYRQMSVERTHRGPLPPAQMLWEYEQVHPGLAERIVRMAEDEQLHRHQLERVEVEEPFRLVRRGQALALAVVVLVLAFAGLLAFLGHAVAGTVLAGVDLLGLVTVFITGQASPGKSESREVERADEDDKPTDG